MCSFFRSKLSHPETFSEHAQAHATATRKADRQLLLGLSTGRFGDECLNVHWLETMADAKVLIAAWRRRYNETRPTWLSMTSHQRYMHPEQFVKARNVPGPR
jgi:integrase-like protein